MDGDEVQRVPVEEEWDAQGNGGTGRQRGG